MSTTHGRGPLGDDELARALSQGLSRSVDGGVDTAALLRGARDGARRIERRRTAVKRGVVTLVVVGLLPFGAFVVRGAGFTGENSSTSAGGAAAAAPEAAGAASAAASASDGVSGLTQTDGQITATPGSSSSTSSERGVKSAPTQPGQQFSGNPYDLPRDAGEVVVPDSAVLSGTQLGLRRVSVESDSAGQTDGARTTVTTVVPLCGTGPAEALAAGGRTLRWSGTAAGRSGATVATAVRVFAGTGAADEVARLRRAVGTCPQSPGVSRETIAGLPGDDVLLAVLPPDATGARPVVGLLRRGRVTVGVEVVLPASSDPAADRADAVARVRALLVRADARVRGFAERAATDSSLA